MTFYVLIFAAGVAAAPPVTQQEPAATPQPPIVVTKERPDEQKEICHSVVETGHIIPKRVCMAKVDWDQIHQRSLKQVQQIRDDQDTQNVVQQTRCIMKEKC